MKPCCELSRKSKIEPVEGFIVAPHDFRAAGPCCDIKRLDPSKGRKHELALAGRFTTNQVCCAPAKVCVNV